MVLVLVVEEDVVDVVTVAVAATDGETLASCAYSMPEVQNVDKISYYLVLAPIYGLTVNVNHAGLACTFD